MSELDPESRALLALARAARTPTADDRARVAKRLTLAAGVSAGAAASVAVTKVASASAPVFATGADAAAQLAATAAGASAKAVARATIASAALKTAVAATLLLSTAIGAYRILAPASSPPPTAAGSPAPRAVAPVRDRPSLGPDAPQAKPERRDMRADTESVSAEAADHTADARATQTRSRSSTLAQELELLHRAQAAWRTRAAPRALELLQRHRRRYPSSELRSERDALEVLALCEVGKTKQAARLARSLLARDPASPARASIEESCALE